MLLYMLSPFSGISNCWTNKLTNVYEQHFIQFFVRSFVFFIFKIINIIHFFVCFRFAFVQKWYDTILPLHHSIHSIPFQFVLWQWRFSSEVFTIHSWIMMWLSTSIADLPCWCGGLSIFIIKSATKTDNNFHRQVI